MSKTVKVRYSKIRTAFKTMLNHFSQEYDPVYYRFTHAGGYNPIWESTLCMCPAIDDVVYAFKMNDSERDKMIRILSTYRPANKLDSEEWFPVSRDGMKKRVEILTKIVNKLKKKKKPLPKRKRSYPILWVVVTSQNATFIFYTRAKARLFAQGMSELAEPRVVKYVPTASH